MWCLGTWFSGGLDSVRLMVGLDDLRGLFQPKQFSDSVIKAFALGTWCSTGAGPQGGCAISIMGGFED